MHTVKIRKKTNLRNYESSSLYQLQNPNLLPEARRLTNASAKPTNVNPMNVFHLKTATRFKIIAEAWLENTKLYLKKSSYSTYETIVSTHLKPYFGKMAIGEISTEHISAFLTDISTCGKSDTDEGLASSTIRGIASVLRSILKFAETEGYEVKTRGCVVRRKEYARKTRILNEREWAQLELCLINDIDASKLGILICMYTGIRLGEICALKWADISIEAGTLAVSKTMQRIKNNTQKAGNKTVIIFDAPKSQSSIRLIPLPSFLLIILKKFEAANNCFVLTGEPKVYVEPRTLQNRFKNILNQAGIEDINFHAIRHTFATKCVNLGFDVKTLSEILGHSDVSVTLNTYVHPSLSVMKSYMERLNNSE